MRALAAGLVPAEPGSSGDRNALAAFDGCHAAFTAYVGRPLHGSSLGAAIFPFDTAWRSGTGEFVCAAVFVSAEAGSVRGSGR